MIDQENNVRIAFIYDEIHDRNTLVPNENRHKYTEENGEEHFIGPEKVYATLGFACFTNEGGEQAYDEDCNPCDTKT